MAENDADESKPKNRVLKFAFRMGSTTDEKTVMTEEFRNNVENYEQYDVAVSKCVNYLENCYLPLAPRTKTDPEDAFLNLSAALNDFKEKVPKPHTGLEAFSKAMIRASTVRQVHQGKQKYVIRHLRRFSIECGTFYNQQKCFEDARRKMDQAKMEVREAKTTANIEKKAICYQMAVDDFDTQTEKLLQIITILPELKKKHNKNIYSFLEKHKEYHADMANRFSKLC